MCAHHLAHAEHMESLIGRMASFPTFDASGAKLVGGLPTRLLMVLVHRLQHMFMHVS